jgi:hypothetical protein
MGRFVAGKTSDIRCFMASWLGYSGDRRARLGQPGNHETVKPGKINARKTLQISELLPEFTFD